MEYEVLAPRGPNDVARIALTVLRSVGWLSREDLATRHGNAGPALPTPGAQCQGVHEFRFAFAPRQAPPRESELCDLGRRFLAPPRVVVGTNGPRQGAPLPRRHSFLTVECVPERAAVLSALKKADDRDSAILRVFNPSPEPARITFGRDQGVAEAFLTNLREQRQGAIATTNGRAATTMGAEKIATLEIAIPRM